MKLMGSRAAVAAVMLAGALASAQAAEKKQLYFVPNGAVDFWKLAEAGMKKAQAELPNYAIQIKYPEQSSAAIQDRLLDDLVANGAAGIMVSSVDPKTQTEALDKVAGQTLLFTTDSDAPRSKRAAYIGSSNKDAGRQAAEILKKALPNGGKCIAFAGLPGADNARERLEGIRESIQGTKIEILDVRADDMDQARAKRNVEDILTARSDVNCMIGVYAYNTPQIYLALQEAGKLGQITVVGFDNDQATLGGIKDGSIAGTVVQQPFEWGYQGMKDMARYLEGDKSFIPADGLIIIPTQIIDKSNVDGFIAQVKTWLSAK
ncbi:sugar-binding protein [Labrys monachus]|uniref:Ribose transport system substrate-binding protein n=1 Tax=Labrys monachus TaxID=217067 RepID=A0ABU0FN10_9HYPH|nr:sugar-binding protein [Labrys monachus]MDQ0396007.1 ribose transport system substrate-binding protein [Labrys monachus]